MSSAEKLSVTLQPVKSVSAPRLAPPAMKRRRAGSGSSLAASLTSSFWSTPGMSSERSRPMMSSPRILAADDHGAQALRHQHRQRDVHDQERADQRHADEVDIARDVVAAEQGRQVLQLHRLPDRKPGQYDHDADHDDTRVQQLLDVIIPGEVVMLELEG